MTWNDEKMYSSSGRQHRVRELGKRFTRVMPPVQSYADGDLCRRLSVGEVGVVGRRAAEQGVDEVRQRSGAGRLARAGYTAIKLSSWLSVRGLNRASKGDRRTLRHRRAVYEGQGCCRASDMQAQVRSATNTSKDSQEGESTHRLYLSTILSARLLRVWSMWGRFERIVWRGRRCGFGTIVGCARPP